MRPGHDSTGTLASWVQMRHVVGQRRLAFPGKLFKNATDTCHPARAAVAAHLGVGNMSDTFIDLVGQMGSRTWPSLLLEDWTASLGHRDSQPPALSPPRHESRHVMPRR